MPTAECPTTIPTAVHSASAKSGGIGAPIPAAARAEQLAPERVARREHEVRAPGLVEPERAAERREPQDAAATIVSAATASAGARPVARGAVTGGDGRASSTRAQSRFFFF